MPRFQDFLSHVRQTGLARANRFYVDFHPPVKAGRSETLTLLCEEAIFPGKKIDTRTLRINALSEQRAHTADYLGKEVTFRFLVDNPWTARAFISEWMNIAVDPVLSTDGSREVGYYRDYIGQVNIFALAPTLDKEQSAKTTSYPAEKKIFEIQLFEVWPTAISSQPTGNAMEGYHRLSVTFAFKWWESFTYEP